MATLKHTKVSKYPSLEIRGAHITPAQEAGFWALVKFDLLSDCWNWTGMFDPKMGYGRFKILDSRYSANRVAYALCYGFVGKDDRVRHTCDNPRCVRPDHLLLGTPKENTADMIARGRKPRGEQVSKCLTDEQALEILQSNMPRRALATKYGVHYSTITKIRGRKNWKHLDPASNAQRRP